MPTAEQSIAGAAGLLLAAAGAWLVLSTFPVADPGRLTGALPDAPTPLVAAPLAIPPFASFVAIKENPFIPFDWRLVEKKAHEPPTEPVIDDTTPTVVGGAQPVPTIARLVATDPALPSATGLLLARGGAQALVTFPGVAHATAMTPGETVAGWTLVGIRDGNVVLLREVASGTLHTLVVADTRTALRATATPSVQPR